MKIRFRSLIFSIAMLFGAITYLTGCASTGTDRAALTGNSMQTVKTGLTRGEMKTGCATGCDLQVTTKTGTGQ